MHQPLNIAPVAIAKAIEHAKEPERPMCILTENAKRFDWSNNPIAEAAGHVSSPLSIGTEVPRYFYIRSMEPSDGEKELSIVEKHIYGSTV